MRNLPPSILVSRNGFSSLHPVKFSNCKHASYPKVHTWHHSLRNRVVVPFQVDLPPASEIDKSWKDWIVSFKMNSISYISINISIYFLWICHAFGRELNLEGNWIWKGSWLRKKLLCKQTNSSKLLGLSRWFLSQNFNPSAYMRNHKSQKKSTKRT